MTSAITFVVALVEAYGINKVKVGDFNANMCQNAHNQNQKVRKAVIEYFKALYKWVGDVVVLDIIEDQIKPLQLVSPNLSSSILSILISIG